jgi:hypothetical protein
MGCAGLIEWARKGPVQAQAQARGTAAARPHRINPLCLSLRHASVFFPQIEAKLGFLRSPPRLAAADLTTIQPWTPRPSSNNSSM